MARPTPLPDDLSRRPFTVADGIAAGLTPSTMRGSGFRAPFRGVRVPAGLPDTLVTDCAALASLLGGGWAFSHATAAALCGLPLPGGVDPRRPLHVSFAPDTPVPHISGVRAHQGLGGRRIHRLGDGKPVIHPAWTWCDLVAQLSEQDAVILGDAVLRRWAAPDVLTTVVAGRAGRRGAVRARRLVGLLRERVDSPMETRLRLLLLRHGVPEPTCGRDVFARDGSGWIARPDLSWPLVAVALEYDGEVHRRDRRQWAKDIARKEAMEDEGWRVLIATSADVFQRQDVLVLRVTNALRERGLAW